MHHIHRNSHRQRCIQLFQTGCPCRQGPHSDPGTGVQSTPREAIRASSLPALLLAACWQVDGVRLTLLLVHSWRSLPSFLGPPFISFISVFASSTVYIYVTWGFRGRRVAVDQGCAS